MADLAAQSFVIAALAVLVAVGWIAFGRKGAKPSLDDDIAARILRAASEGDPWAAQMAREALGEMAVPNWFAIDEAVNALITFGRYEEALQVERLWAETDIDGSLSDFVLVQINLAEALYNLGRWNEAWELLEGLDDAAETVPITRGGLLVQRAWIAAHDGRHEEARDLASRADPEWFPRAYRAEVFFARGVASLGLGDHARATREVEEGLAMAERASSVRNGAFLLARIAVAAGNVADAERHFRAAVEHPYRGQGGDGLLAWGDFLAAAGRTTEARAAWTLATERDPESESAAIARTRLALV